MNTEVFHRNDIPWYEAPAPPKRHAHWAQTWGWTGDSIIRIDRCPCGAMRNDSFDAWVLLDTPRVAEKTFSKPTRAELPESTPVVATPRGRVLLDILKVAAILACFILAGVLATHSLTP